MISMSFMKEETNHVYFSYSSVAIDSSSILQLLEGLWKCGTTSGSVLLG